MSDRLTAITAATATPQQREVMLEIQRDRNLPDGKLGRIFALLLASPGAARCVGKVGAHCRFNSALPKQLREVVVLATTYHLGFEMENRAHEPLALEYGITPANLTALKQGKFSELPEGMRQLAQLSNAVSSGKEVGDALFESVRATYGNDAVVDTVVMAGYYLMLYQVNRTLMPEG